LPSSTTYAGPVVANPAAASALGGIADGQSIYVLTQRAYYQSNPNDTLPITASDANQRIPRAGGGTLNRTDFSDPVWRWQITDIYMDPSNTTGIASDANNQGIFTSPQVGNARAPLRTWQELRRRIGCMQRMTSGAVDGTVTIHVISDLDIFNINDLVELEIYAGQQTFPVVQGESVTIYLNSVLAAVQIQNPSVPAPGGTDYEITVGVFNFAPYIGYQLYFPATGAVATVLKSIGAGVARISQPVITNKATDALTPTATNPNPGDAVQIRLYSAINVGSCKFRFSGSTNSASGFWKWQTMQIVVNTQSDLWSVVNEVESTYNLIYFYEMNTLRVILDEHNVVWSGSHIAAGYQSVHPMKDAGGGVWGSGIVPLDNRPHIYVSGKPSHAFNRGVFDFDTAVQDGFVAARGDCQMAAFSVWDSPTTGNNPNGHALLIGETLNQRIVGSVVFTGGTPIFGTGATGNGMQIQTGSQVVYETLPNITGAADFGMGAFAAGWYFAVGAAIYAPPAGPIAFSWANLVLAQPVGFGSNAHRPDINTHIMLASGA